MSWLIYVSFTVRRLPINKDRNDHQTTKTKQEIPYFVGIGIEGIGCVLAGAWGSGNATTSYSENIGAIGITRVRTIK